MLLPLSFILADVIANYVMADVIAIMFFLLADVIANYVVWDIVPHFILCLWQMLWPLCTWLMLLPWWQMEIATYTWADVFALYITDGTAKCDS